VNYAIKDAKEWARATLRGFVVCPTTPFHDDYSLDEEGMRGNIAQFVDLESTSGLYVNSVFGEHYNLSMAERKRLAEIAVEEAAGRVPVFVEVTTEGYIDAIDLANHARDCGVDAVILGSPLSGLRTRQGVLNYVRAVAAETDIGIGMFTTTWADVGFHIDAGMLLELAQLDAVCVVKDATGGLAATYDMFGKVEPKVRVSRPSLPYWLAARHVMGGDLVAPLWLGVVAPIYADRLCKRFEDAVHAESWPEASDAMLELAHLQAGLAKNHATGHHDVAFMKAVSALCGYAAGPVRPPLTYPADQELEVAKALLDGAGALPAAARS
jgi:4-hydroxy-tetrahydrodipicolinate synthase